MTPWLIWLISAIVMLVIEVFTGTVAALCLAVGCVLALIPAAVGAEVVMQFVVASAGAVVAFLVLSPVVRKYKLNKATRRDERSNMDAIIGRTGIVTEPIYPGGRQGRVKVDGDNWLAEAEAEYCPIQKGDSVEVVSYESIVIKVRPKN
ncbi:MAG: NfeD family protein [Muribaculaceae bacterium]|nr:NfeD family protein [Muribaculaceae bacterium]MDE6345284.1 NfeD family protein [Muribaculaceae bacterium]